MPAGICVLLGSARKGTETSFEMPFLQNGRTVRGVIQGDSVPQEFVPVSSTISSPAVSGVENDHVLSARRYQSRRNRRGKDHQARSAHAALSVGGLSLLGDACQPAQHARGAFEAVYRSWPLVEEHQLLTLSIFRIGARQKPEPCSRMKAISPSGLAKTLSRNDSTMPSVPPPPSPHWRAAERLDRHHLQQMLDFLWQLAEPVDELRRKAIDLTLVLDVGEPPVKRQPHREIGHVVFRNEQSCADGDLR